MFERLAQLAVIRPQYLRGADMDDAVGASLQHGIERAQPHRAQRRGFLYFSQRVCHQVPGFTFGSRFSSKSLSLALASPSAWAMARPRLGSKTSWRSARRR